MSIVSDYYNRVYSPQQLHLDEKAASFQKIKAVWKETKNPMTVLDIGCGAGSVSHTLCDAGHAVVGLDVMHDAAKKAAGKGLLALVQDVEEGLPFLSGTFDAVIALDVIEHLFDPYAFMKEVRRTMRDDGIFILEIPNHFDIAQRINTFLGKGIVPHVSRQINVFTDAWSHPHIRFPNHEESLRIVKETGFLVDGIEYPQMMPWDFHRWNLPLQKYRVRRILAERYPAVFAKSFRFRLVKNLGRSES